MTSRYPIAPFPEGWFQVAWSRDLGRRGVLPRRWCGRDVVLYRGESGQAHVLDAYCPHVGAHLGHGGRVHGERIMCPFHGWEMDCSGRCVHVPLVKKIPPKARVGRYPVCEVSGAILAYARREGAPEDSDAAPRWTPQALEGWDDPAWTTPQILEPWRVRTHVQEFGENGVDLGHAVVLHSHITRAAETVFVESDGPVLRHRSRHHYRVFGPLEWLGKKVVGTLETRIDGFGRVAAHARVDAGIQIENRVVFYPTPIDDEWVELNAAVYLRKQSNWLLTRALHAKSVREARKTIDQDTPIWSNKRYEARPLLVAGEEAMGHYRRWARQFYGAPEAVAEHAS
jgi:phenylpropionate dioxygenase-like ring-hydroxylating dioxygenase large terminal subunit